MTSRRSATYWTRVSASLLAMLAMLWLLVVSAAGSTVAGQGKVLFTALASLAFTFALLVGVGVTSDCLSSEKREGTLGLLFLTDLKGYDVVLGKLASSSLASFYSLLAVVPVLALALLIGGVSLLEVLRVSVVLLNTMFFSLSVGLFVSTLSYNERKAMFATFVLIGFFTLFPVVVLVFCQEMLEMKLPDRVEALILLPSPLLSFMLTFSSGPWSKAPLAFVAPVALLQALSWAFLISASGLLTRVSHDRPKTVRREKWSKIWQNWSYGGDERRRHFRRHLLDQNAFFWLAARERLKPHLVWFFLGVLGGLWAWGSWNYAFVFADWEIAPMMLFLVHGFLKLWFASEVCARLAEDRRTGALELLLSSPLSMKEIARGQWLALRRQFFWPVVALLTVDGSMMLAAPSLISESRRGVFAMFPAGMTVLILDLAALRWVGMRLALAGNNLSRVLLGTIGRVLVLPWLIWFLLLSSVTFIQFVFVTSISLSVLGLVGMWATLSIATDLLFGLAARHRLLRDFRVLAAARFEATARRPIASWRARIRAAGQLREKTRLSAFKAALRRHWIAASAMALLMVGFSSLAVYRGILKNQVRRELEAIRRRGEPVLGADFDKWHPAVLQDENAAAQLQPLLGAFFFQGPLTNQAAIKAMVEQNAKTLQSVHQIARMRKSRMNLDWGDVQGRGFWPLWRLNQLAQLLGMEATVHLQKTNPAAAIESVQTILGLAHIVGMEPSLQAQIWRLHLVQQALTGLEPVLAGPLPEEARLEQLQNTLARFEQETLDSNRWTRALAGDRFRLIQFYESTDLGSALSANGPLPAPMVARLQLFFGFQKLVGLWDRNFLRSLALMRSNIATIKLPFPDRLARARQFDGNMRDRVVAQTAGLFGGFGFTLGPAIIENDADTVARLRGAETALALERFRLQHGKSPPELKELVPQFLSQLPVDPIDQQPLKYEQSPRGYSFSSLRNPPPKSTRAGTNPNRISSLFAVKKETPASHAAKPGR